MKRIFVQTECSYNVLRRESFGELNTEFSSHCRSKEVEQQNVLLLLKLNNKYQLLFFETTTVKDQVRHSLDNQIPIIQMCMFIKAANHMSA